MKKQLIVLSAMFIVFASQGSYYDRMKAAAASKYATMKESAQGALSSAKGKFGSLADTRETVGSAWGSLKQKGRVLISKVSPTVDKVETYDAEGNLINTELVDRYANQ